MSLASKSQHQAESDLQMRAWHGCNGSWRSHRETSTWRFIWWRTISGPHQTIVSSHTISYHFQKYPSWAWNMLGSLSGSPIEIWRAYSFDFVFEDLDGFSCFSKGLSTEWLTSMTYLVRPVCVRLEASLGPWLPSIPISASLLQPM